MSQDDKRARRRKRPASAGYSVPEAGEMVGLSRNGSYLAAARGEIPTIRFGSKLVVPKAPWDRKLGLTEPSLPLQPSVACPSPPSATRKLYLDVRHVSCRADDKRDKRELPT